MSHDQGEFLGKVSWLSRLGSVWPSSPICPRYQQWMSFLDEELWGTWLPHESFEFRLWGSLVLCVMMTLFDSALPSCFHLILPLGWGQTTVLQLRSSAVRGIAHMLELGQMWFKSHIYCLWAALFFRCCFKQLGLFFFSLVNTGNTSDLTSDPVERIGWAHA